MDDEPILLHEPNLMRAILHTAHDRPAGHDDAMAELEVTLRAAHEPMPEDRAELAGRLNEAFDLLAAAAALAPAGDGRYRLTKRGAELLASHPQGIDQTILAAFPEFQRFLARRQQPAAGNTMDEDGMTPPGAARLDAYIAGLEGFATGRPAHANPYPTDTGDHLAWVNGWCEARDNRKEGT